MAEVIIVIRDKGDDEGVDFELVANPEIDLDNPEEFTSAQVLGVELLTHAQAICGIKDEDLKMGKNKVEEITLTDFEKLCAEAFELREKIDLVEENLKGLNKELMGIQGKILAQLQAHEKDNYQSGQGTVYVNKQFTVTQPQDPEKKKQFFDYLKARGVFEDIASINYQTLNSFYKQEMEAAREAGDIDFQVPGISEPRYVETLRMRKKR